eukprot:CAMPEP_0116090470 /NCGR_PEP_ID=MMETSP0327-20121206/6993_1 /TAXON_ID=44447 /ORGANISM="Pseudo-nitzschia delicatissima, Strain B596" /LENGTH=537 /DNA_ID=CAMNT_0003581765 /DNA_START=57 /DNA_END=1670 /DNA_ORIENTATION=+
MSDLSPVPTVPIEAEPTADVSSVSVSVSVSVPPMNGTTELTMEAPPSSQQQSQQQQQQQEIQVVLPLEEFAEDLELRLGRANGNIYQRRTGIEGMHDGQVMVRLKKKRFIVIDYGIVPHEQDLQAAAMHPNISVPLGAGVTKCTGKVASEQGGPLVQCKKVGVPVLLYDSEPDQPPSLYLRSGLCFICQRNLNEKRRTQRKRPSERANQAAKVSANAQHSQAAFLAAHPLVPNVNVNLNANGVATSALPGMQTVRIGGIGAQASLVGAGTTGRVNATPHHRVLMAVTNGHKKIKLAHTNQPLVLAPDAIILNGPPDNHSCKSVRQGHGFAEIGTDLSVEVHQALQSTNTMLHSVVNTNSHSHSHSHSPEMIQQGITIPTPTPDEIARTYDQAFYSLSKSLYLLVQWKTSWDAAIASAIQQEAHAPMVVLESHHSQHTHSQHSQHSQHTHSQQPPPMHQAALQAASMANAAATAAIGGMIHGNPGSIPCMLPSEPTNLAQAVASAAAVAAVSQPQAAIKKEKTTPEGASAPLDQSVEV